MKDDPQALFHIQTPRIEQTQRPKNSRTSHRTAKEKVPILLGEKTWMKPFQISNPGVLKRNNPFQTISDHSRPFQTSYLTPHVLLWVTPSFWPLQNGSTRENIPSFVPEPWHFFFHHSSSPKAEGLNFKQDQLCPLELPQFLTDAGMSVLCIVGVEAACEEYSIRAWDQPSWKNSAAAPKSTVPATLPQWDTLTWASPKHKKNYI